MNYLANAFIDKDSKQTNMTAATALSVLPAML